MYTYSRAIRGGMAAALLLSLTLTTAAQTIPAARPQEARVVCGARGIARQQCGADLRGYVFSRLVDAAGSHCEIGRNFGYSDAAVWVEQNCGGEFFFVYRGARTAVPVAAGAGSADRAVRCESQDGRPASCPMDLSYLDSKDIRQLSRTQCVDRQNWRWDDRGCTLIRAVTRTLWPRPEPIAKAPQQLRRVRSLFIARWASRRLPR
ncbi:MAG: DUF3011 domain-containing protein [Steroidobacteraceae bacterium]